MPILLLTFLLLGGCLEQAPNPQSTEDQGKPDASKANPSFSATSNSRIQDGIKTYVLSSVRDAENTTWAQYALYLDAAILNFSKQPGCPKPAPGSWTACISQTTTAELSDTPSMGAILKIAAEGGRGIVIQHLPSGTRAFALGIS